MVFDNISLHLTDISSADRCNHDKSTLTTSVWAGHASCWSTSIPSGLEPIFRTLLYPPRRLSMTSKPRIYTIFRVSWAGASFWLSFHNIIFNENFRFPTISHMTLINISKSPKGARRQNIAYQHIDRETEVTWLLVSIHQVRTSKTAVTTASWPLPTWHARDHSRNMLKSKTSHHLLQFALPKLCVSIPFVYQVGFTSSPTATIILQKRPTSTCQHIHTTELTRSWLSAYYFFTCLYEHKIWNN